MVPLLAMDALSEIVVVVISPLLKSRLPGSFSTVIVFPSLRVKI